MDDSAPSAVLSGPLQKPQSVSDTGVRKGILEDLALKVLYLSGPSSAFELSNHMRLGLGVVDELLRRLRAEQLCEVTGMSGNVPNVAITSRGRAQAQELLSQNQYAGAAPVSLESYVEQVREQSVCQVAVHPPDVERALAHLVLDSNIIWQIGTALNSGTAIFLYGPTGVGKTAIAEALSHVVAEDKVWIPFAVEVDGQIIALYDPLIHKSAVDPPPGNGDGRWVLCHRPVVLVGGELTMEMLDLQFNALTKFYACPVQMKANNGVLIIDDFGRQRLRPEALLDRWIVPLAELTS
jgi:predicted ATPase with chaperone activity